MSKKDAEPKSNGYIEFEQETPEQRTNRLRGEGDRLYREMRMGNEHWVGPLFGGHRTRHDDFVVRKPADLFLLAIKQLKRPVEEILEDHELIGYNPDELTDLNPVKHIRSFLQGMGDAALDYGDPQTIRGIRNIITWSETPEIGLPDIPGLRFVSSDQNTPSHTNTIVILKQQPTELSPADLILPPKKADC